MKFNSSFLAAFAVLGCVHAFKVGGPPRIQLRKARSQRAPWTGMLDEASAVAPAPKKKRSMTVQFVQETPGGYICDLDVTNFRTSTSHRIVMSKDLVKQFSELSEKQVEVPALCMYTIKYMLDKGMKLDNTEGMIEASVFPVNYFTIKQLTYFHDDVHEKIVELCKQAPDLTEW